MPEQNESEQKAKVALDKSVEKLGSAPELAEPSQPAADSPVPDTEPVLGEDLTTEKAVDDITRNEGDEVLKVQDQAAQDAVVMQPGKWERFKNWNAEWWGNPKKRWSTIALIVAVFAALFAVPVTRYNILGVVLKAPVTVQAVDSKTGAPVSGATVELSGHQAETQANGKATFRVNTGSGSLKVSKKYYTGYSHGELVGTSKNSFKATLIATGRQVQVKLVNKITAKPLSGATVSAGGAKAKTDTKGLATLVIPSGADTQPATVSYSGYNGRKVSIVASGGVAKNTFSVTPSGKLYFLSNLGGTIDVVKTNLDGSDRQTVLAGTGTEDKYNTSLLASRDWKYLALLSKRSGDNASVYLIDTTNGDKLTTIDEGSAKFSLIGWSGDKFIYEVDRSVTISNWQPNQQALKSFNPTTGHALLLDQTNAAGVSDRAYAKQYFGGVYLMGNDVVYVKNWQGQGVPDGTPIIPANELMHNRQASLETIDADGSGHQTLKSIGVDSCNDLSVYCQYNIVSLNSELYEPDGLYLQFNNGGSEQYYEYGNGKVSADSSLTADTINTPYATFLASPSASKTFWSEPRDGKNALFVGDDDAQNRKIIANLSDYNTYGWYTDDYLLVSKNSSELYVMGKDGGTPIKITDYYKPAINYNGYGGGYGGL
jgi:hypothetical protein